MNLKVKKSLVLNGKVIPPSSKSQSIRGIILALLSEGESTLMNILDSDDAEDAINVCKKLGANINIHGNKLLLKSEGLPINTDIKAIHTGNSGITTRFILPLLGLRKHTQQSIIINCGEQMRARPIQSLVTALTHLGLSIEYLENEGVLPVSVSGSLKGGIAEVDGITSQYISALLISLPCAEQDSEIFVKNLHERPYMEMTLAWLKEQYIQFTHSMEKNTDIFHIKGNQRYKSFTTTIAGDFSSASYLIAAATLTEGCVELSGLNMQDPQGDKRLVTILQEMGADITIEHNSLIIQGGKLLKGIKIDANDIPDLLPTLAVIGTQAMGKTEIINVRQARIKETDRIHSMTEGLTLLGAKVDEHDDGLTVYQSKLQGASVSGYDDHRTVMALSVAGMLAEGLTVIDDAEAINKTYPKYIETMRSIGAKMEVENEIDT
jgi:3-phosphoshikimate 1-carboxyvinyltransferase